MLPTKELYTIYPSVVPADQTVSMTVAPLERAFMLFDDVEYLITVAHLNYDENNYYDSTAKKEFTVFAKDGVIKFDYKFPGEQEHLVILSRDGVAIEKFAVYSLEEDLYSARPMKSDLHSHSFRSDGQRDPSALASFYREQGYDCFALTDHNRFYPGGEIDETYSGVNTGFLRIPGEEVHTPPSIVHIVRLGGDKSVCEKYVKNPTEYDAEIEEYIKKVPSEVPEAFVSRYARAMWATDNIHAEGGIAIFAHPFWRPRNLVYNVCEEYARILLKSGMFDAFEVLGGIDQALNNRSLALWNDLRAEGFDIPAVASSDVHSLNEAKHFPAKFTIVFSADNTADAVIAAVKAGRCVAVETSGMEREKEYRAYGKLRFVNYAQFLLKYFFPEYERVCEGGGIAMRAYAMGGAPKQLVDLEAELAENFRLRFFGRKEALCPTPEMIAFENKWRAAQLDGPLTKGSGLYSTPNRQL